MDQATVTCLLIVGAIIFFLDRREKVGAMKWLGCPACLAAPLCVIHWFVSLECVWCGQAEDLKEQQEKFRVHFITA